MGSYGMHLNIPLKEVVDEGFSFLEFDTREWVTMDPQRVKKRTKVTMKPTAIEVEFVDASFVYVPSLY